MVLTLKHHATQSLETDRLARTYMIGASTLSRKELRQKLADAKADSELKGKVRELVLQRYAEMLRS